MFQKSGSVPCKDYYTRENLSWPPVYRCVDRGMYCVGHAHHPDPESRRYVSFSASFSHPFWAQKDASKSSLESALITPLDGGEAKARWSTPPPQTLNSLLLFLFPCATTSKSHPCVDHVHCPRFGLGRVTIWYTHHNTHFARRMQKQRISFILHV